MNLPRSKLSCVWLLGFVVARIGSTCSIAADSRYEPNWASLDARPMPEWYLDAKFGVFIHWGVYSVPAWGQLHEYAESYWKHVASNNANDAAWREFHARNYGPNFNYMDFAPRFTAELFDARQPDCEAPRRFRSLVERRGQSHLGSSMERRRNRAEARPSW
jgi:hypothetical protein